MLRFFRQIRKQHLMSDTKRKYIVYALGEVGLVMIGILLALQVNTWNEDRKLQELSDKTLLSLQTELQEAKSNLERIIDFNQDLIEDSELYIYGEFSRDSLERDPGVVFRFTNYAPISFELPVLERELSSDRLIMGQEELNTKLREINNQTVNITESIFYLDEFRNNQVVPYFVEKKAMVYLHQDLRGRQDSSMKNAMQNIFEDEEYRNMAAMCNLFVTAFTDQSEQLVEVIDETLVLIEEKN